MTKLLATTLLILIFATAALAQSNKGAIVGTVKDPNDALVSKAQVKVTSVKTGEVRTTDTSDDGTYTVTNLEPGAYNVTVEGSGFQAVTIEAVQVETNSRLPLDVKFANVASTSSSVTITAESAPLVESETSVRGDLITGRQVTDLPIPQRNFTLLAGLSPGVTRPNLGLLGGGGNFVDGGGGQNNTESTRFRESGGSVLVVNGARATNNNFTLDGVDNNESQFGQIAIYPQPDAIAEFKIESSVPSAESGRAGGGIISTTFKSGGNEVHGTAGEIYQGRFLSAAAGKFDNPDSPPVPNTVTHNYYGTVGGPIFLPKPGEGGSALYDGRNRSFFFFSLNGQRNSTPIFGGTGDPQAVPVPTARMRLGDFGELLQPGVLQEYTLVGNVKIMATKGTIFAPNGTPIPGNDLRNCPSCGPFSPFAVNYVNAFPLPNLPVIGRNFETNRKEHAVVDSYDIRIDHRLTDSNSLFGRYSKSNTARARDNFFPLGTSPNGNDLPAGPSAGDEFGDSKGFTLGDTHIFSPTVVNDARFGYTRVQIGIFNTGVNGTGGFSPTVSANLGAPNINISPNTSGIVLVGIVDNFNGQDRATEFTGDGGPFYFLSNNFHVADAVTVVKGNSTYKFGGDYRIRQNSNFDGGRNGGTKGNYQYGTTDSGFVSGNYNGIGPNDTGSSLANFLLGYRPGFVTRGDPGGPYYQSSKEIAFFVQDDWKVNPDLTLNLDLRYDIFTAPTERFDLQSNFVPETRTLQMAGDNAPGGRDLADTDKNNFGPRIGFAYSGFKGDKTLVLRGGYGLLYATDTSAAQPLTSNPGTGAASYSCNPITNPGGCPAFFLARNPFDRGVPTAPFTVQAPGTSFLAPTGGTIRFNDPNRKDEMYHQYNLTWQYEFAPNWLAEAAYVGSLGRNLLVLQNIGNAGDQGGPGSREVPNISQVIAQRYTGSSRYDSLQTKLEKRFVKGLSVLASYTWAHAIDDSPGGICSNGASARDCGFDNPLRPDLDRGNADTDVRHRFTFSDVWDLPFGRGRRFGTDMNRGVDAVVGGWQFNNIVVWQSGPVFNVTCDSGRVDIIGDPTPTSAQQADGRELNRNAFRCSTTRIFPGDPPVSATVRRQDFPNIGSLGRNVFRGRQQFYWDASFFKNFPISAISEAFNVQFRFSAYNVLNRANRSSPKADFNNEGEFGRDISEQRRRQMEFSLKFIF
ncbi:MAG TPA: carboxypeptidase regulatory-like domain-containing protein [Pyrinomonadaceae bacterium]|nr:carboxypeptidase regulatory-like domain-containing protein [Pyrinomonadaceae bacterium]